MSKGTEIRKWPTEQLILEMRRPQREELPETYTLLIVEALARLLHAGMLSGEIKR